MQMKDPTEDESPTVLAGKGVIAIDWRIENDLPVAHFDIMMGKGERLSFDMHLDEVLPMTERLVRVAMEMRLHLVHWVAGFIPEDGTVHIMPKEEITRGEEARFLCGRATSDGSGWVVRPLYPPPSGEETDICVVCFRRYQEKERAESKNTHTRHR